MTPETKLATECKLWCGEHNYIMIRQQSGTFYSQNGMPVKIGFEGLSDYIIFGNNGDCYFVETKIHPRKPTQKQLEFLALMRSRGFKCGVVYSVSDLERLIRG